MRRLLLSTLFCLFATVTTQADPVVFLPNGEIAFNTSFTTSGFFECENCTGSGSNSVVFGSGGNTVMLTFTGANVTDLLVGAGKVPATIGQIQVVASGSGFVFPVGGNGNLPVLFLHLGINQTSPNAGGTGILFFGFGGSTSILMAPLGTDHGAIPISELNPPGFSYTFLIYTFHNFTIPNSNAVVNIDADISAVPEPASVLLLSSGLGAILTLRKKRSSKR